MKNISDNAIFDNLAPDYDSWFLQMLQNSLSVRVKCSTASFKLEKDCQILDIGRYWHIFSRASEKGRNSSRHRPIRRDAINS